MISNRATPFILHKGRVSYLLLVFLRSSHFLASVRGCQSEIIDDKKEADAPTKLNGEAIQQAMEKVCSKMKNLVGKEAVDQLVHPKSNMAELRYFLSLSLYPLLFFFVKSRYKQLLVNYGVLVSVIDINQRRHAAETNSSTDRFAVLQSDKVTTICTVEMSTPRPLFPIGTYRLSSLAFHSFD
jgi:hypothetical protein